MQSAIGTKGALHSMLSNAIKCNARRNMIVRGCALFRRHTRRANAFKVNFQISDIYITWLE